MAIFLMLLNHMSKNTQFACLTKAHIGFIHRKDITVIELMNHINFAKQLEVLHDSVFIKIVGIDISERGCPVLADQVTVLLSPAVNVCITEGIWWITQLRLYKPVEALCNLLACIREAPISNLRCKGTNLNALQGRDEGTVVSCLNLGWSALDTCCECCARALEEFCNRTKRNGMWGGFTLEGEGNSILDIFFLILSILMMN